MIAREVPLPTQILLMDPHRRLPLQPPSFSVLLSCTPGRFTKGVTSHPASRQPLNGRAYSSLTAIGGGLAGGVTAPEPPPARAFSPCSPASSTPVGCAGTRHGFICKPRLPTGAPTALSLPCRSRGVNDYSLSSASLGIAAVNRTWPFFSRHEKTHSHPDTRCHVRVDNHRTGFSETSRSRLPGLL
jgi:hypothetical protein